MPFIVALITAALLVMAGTAILNALLFPRLKAARSSQTGIVSVLIPARNEAGNIASTVRAMLAQSDVAFELLILDDHSEDGTGSLAMEAGAGDPRLRILKGQDLPQGWSGKNWACHQLAAAAQGQTLLFTDADVTWHPGALAALIAMMQAQQADLLTVWPTQETLTWSERICVPLMAMVILSYLPILLVHYVPLAAFGAANGQCMAWRREAYERLGGHARVASSVLDDVNLARLLKPSGMRLRMADAAGLMSCRMYQDWPSVRDGYAKNILAGYGSPAALIAGAIFHWLVFWGPWLLLLGDRWRGIGLLAILLGIIIRALTAATSQQRIADALSMPLAVGLMSRIALQSIIWHYRGGPRWKGRVL